MSEKKFQETGTQRCRRGLSDRGADRGGGTKTTAYLGVPRTTARRYLGYLGNVDTALIFPPRSKKQQQKNKKKLDCLKFTDKNEYWTNESLGNATEST